MTVSYPLQRFAVLHEIGGRALPAYAPNAELDAADAYAPFLHATLASAQAEIDGDAESRKADLEGADESLHDDPDAYWAVACTVAEDGTLTYEGDTLTRADIFEAYGMADPAAPQP